jgi:hypothetical protein|tara:strand:- start:49 stop:540 length:492 start_codon:yes stop_codon:yes gene_type:complete
MKNLLLMLGLIISLSCLSQNDTTEYKFYTPTTTDYLINPTTPDSTIESKFTQIQMGGLIYVTVEYYMIVRGNRFLPVSKISVVFDMTKEKANVTVNDEEMESYSIYSIPQQLKGYDKSFIRQSEDKTYVQLTVRNDGLEVFNTFKILLPEKSDIEMSRRLYGN